MAKGNWKIVDKIYVVHSASDVHHYGSDYWYNLPTLSHVHGEKINNAIICGGRLETFDNKDRSFTIVGPMDTRSGTKFVVVSDDYIYDTIPAESLYVFVKADGIDKDGLIKAKLKWYLKGTQLRLDLA